MSSARSCRRNTVSEGANRGGKLFLATSNSGKIEEFRTLAAAAAKAGAPAVSIELLPRFSSLSAFPEDAPTFAENAAGKALYYSRLTDICLLADDSGLIVPSLGGIPGVQSARYAGPNAMNEQRIAKLLAALHGKTGSERAAYFV